MTPNDWPIPVADPLPLPGPYGLLWALLQLTLVLHLVAMNVTLGGSVLALFCRRSGNPHAQTFARWFAKALPVAVATTVTLGVAPLLFVQVLYGRLFFTSSILLGGYWLALVPLLIVAYYGAYRLAFRASVESTPTSTGHDRAPAGADAALAPDRSGTAVAAVRTGMALAAVVTVLFVAVSFLQSSNAALQLRPEAFLAKYHLRPWGFHLDLDDRSFLPRWLHAVLGAVAVAGAFLAFVGWLRRKSDEGFASWAVRTGLSWFAWTTAANVVLGTWYALALPRPTLARIAGADPWAASLLALGSMLGLALVAIAVLGLSGKDPARAVLPLVGHLGVTLVLMVLLREEVRRSALLPAGFAHHGWVEPQWSAIAAFGVCLAVAIGTIWWMVRVLARSEGESQGTSPSR